MHWSADLPPALRSRVQGALWRLRLRQLASDLLCAALPLAGLAVLTGRFISPGAGAMTLVAGLTAALAWTSVRAARLGPAQLVRRLDSAAPAFEDSSALALLHGAAPLNPVEGLQRARIRDRISAAPLAAFTQPLTHAWPLRRLALAGALGAVLATAALIPLPGSREAEPAATPSSGGNAAAAAVTIGLEVTPPAYTGQRPLRIDGGDARVPAGSRVRWTLRLDQTAQQAALLLHDGSSLPLQSNGADWVAERTVDDAMLLRLHTDGHTHDSPRWRIDVLPDGAPSITVEEPARSLNEADASTTLWALRIQARDDYGLGQAELLLTHTHGGGEQVEVTEQRIPLQGDGNARERRYSHSVTLAELGYAEGDDLIARFIVTDNRSPEPNVAESAATILRWTPPPFMAGDADLEGVVRDTLPAYFRSQRQIIIDSEALVGERAQLDDEPFAQRSYAIAADQRLLRLRYGQFMGEESEVDDAPPGEGEHSDADGHEHGGDDAPAASFGDGGDMLAEFGHTHDHAEAATLFDPETRAILRRALDAMWRAEEQLRLARPEDALPHENQALDAIKQLQQASRVYLARVGAELPEVDPGRRLSGKRDELQPLTATLPQRADDRAAVTAAWAALREHRPLDRAALLAWMEQAGDTVADPLSLQAALDDLQRDPGCAACRERLQAQLWPLLPLPAAGVTPRTAESTVEPGP